MSVLKITLLLIGVGTTWFLPTNGNETFKRACQKISSTPEEVADCSTFLNNKITTSFTKDFLKSMMLEFSNKGLKLNYVKEFFQKVIDVEKFGCNCSCVSYLMKCIGVDQIGSWTQVLKFGIWPFWSEFVDIGDTTPNSFCKNALQVTNNVENLYLLVVYNKYLGRGRVQSTTKRCDFLQLLKINVLYKEKSYWESYKYREKKNLFKKLFSVICGSSWNSERIEYVINYIKTVKISNRIKPYAIEPVFTLFSDSALLGELNNFLQIAFEVVSVCNEEYCVTKMMDLFGFVYKVTKDISTLPKLLKAANDNWYVARGLSICLFTVEKTKPAEERLMNYYRKFLEFANFFEDLNSPDLCKLLAESYSVSNWDLLYEGVTNAVDVDWNATSAMEFFCFLKGGKSLTVGDVRSIVPLQKFIARQLHEDKWPELSDRKLDGWDYEYYNTVPKVKKGVSFFFSRRFREVYEYRSCPLYIVIDILQKYDKPIDYVLNEGDYVDLVSLMWQREIFNASPIKHIFKTFSFTSIVVNILKEKGMNNVSLPSLVDTMLKNYDPYIAVIIGSYFNSFSELNEFIIAGTENDKGSPFDWELIVKLLVRVKSKAARTLLSEMKPFSMDDVLSTTVLSLTNEEIMKLAPLVNGFSINLTPSGSWSEMDLVNWLLFVHRDEKPCLGTKYLLKNHSKTINELIDNLKSIDEESKWNDLCTE